MCNLINFVEEKMARANIGGKTRYVRVGCYVLC